MRDHGHLTAVRRELAYDPEHYALYLRYQRYRHPGGGMDQDSREQYQHFLLHSNVATDLYEFREGDVLRMVSLVDRLVDGLSSVYTFFEPDIRSASFGTYSVLWQIERCAELEPAVSLSRVLDRREPQDGLQGHVPAGGGPGRRHLDRALAGSRYPLWFARIANAADGVRAIIVGDKIKLCTTLRPVYPQKGLAVGHFVSHNKSGNANRLLYFASSYFRGFQDERAR